jgi:glutamate dehydrogenase/leucine dehydrogenase
MSRIADASPAQLAARLRGEGVGRAYLVQGAGRRTLRASHPLLEELAASLGEDLDAVDPEAVFLQVAPSAEALFAAFVHRTRRGQAQGGLRRRTYDHVHQLLRDGLRLSRAMTRKNALAGLWWGGGKGILADTPEMAREPVLRAALYREYGAFVSSLRGCYVTAEDAGTQPADMAEVFAATRFATCVPPEAGGSGNPAPTTAAGVLCALDAALDFHGLGSIEGKTVAVQGAGNVGSALVERLLERRAGRIVVSDLSAERCAALLDRFEGLPLEVRLVPAGDDSILGEPCDVLAPCGLGGVLGPKTIRDVRARIVCGAANNPLVDEERDAADLARRGVTYVPDVLANRMGIVQCANEQYGTVSGDAGVRRHLGHEWPNSIYQMTLRVLELAQRCGTTPLAAALRLADDLAREPHPLWGHRGRLIVESLVADRWERQLPG